MSLRSRRVTIGLCALLLCGSALAGPPYVADDPEPAETGHVEAYLFSEGVTARGGYSTASGIDFNYGATKDLQLTAVLPALVERPPHEARAAGLGNVELAVKYRFIHEDELGFELAVFPRVTLPSPARRIAERHPSWFLPLWFEKDFGEWSTFGGGGCALNHGRDTRGYCQTALALTRQVLPALQLGTELQHQTSDAADGRASTGIGVGARYDLDAHEHLLAYAAPGLQHPAHNGRYAWYVALEMTY